VIVIRMVVVVRVVRMPSPFDNRHLGLGRCAA